MGIVAEIGGIIGVIAKLRWAKDIADSQNNYLCDGLL